MKQVTGVTADTEVVCSADNRSAKIVGVRESVNTYSSDNSIVSRQVLAIDISEPTSNIIKLTFSNKFVVYCGWDTEFLMSDGSFLRCSDIPVGALLFTFDSSIVELEEFSFYHDAKLPLFKLKVGSYCGVELPNHTFVRIGE